MRSDEDEVSERSRFRDTGADLQRWVGEVLRCPVLLTSAGHAPPRSAAGAAQAVLCWLGVKSIVVRPLERWTRVTAQLEYLIYFDGGDPLEQHAQLETLLVAAASSDLRCAPPPSEAAWWAALGGAPRPALSVTREVATDTAPRELAPPARQVISVTRLTRLLSGRVLLPSGEPCAGATLRVAGAPGSAISGNDGRFSLLATAGEAPTLKLTHPMASGLRVQLDAGD